MSDYIRMRKTRFHAWRWGIRIGQYWISWGSPLRVRKAVKSASVLSKTWDFFPKADH